MLSLILRVFPLVPRVAVTPTGRPLTVGVPTIGALNVAVAMRGDPRFVDPRFDEVERAKSGETVIESSPFVTHDLPSEASYMIFATQEKPLLGMKLIDLSPLILAVPQITEMIRESLRIFPSGSVSLDMTSTVMGVLYAVVAESGFVTGARFGCCWTVILRSPFTIPPLPSEMT